MNKSLEQAITTRKAMETYQDKVYLNLIRQINENSQVTLKDNLGSEFVFNCGRDIASELVRNCFQTSDFHITVDQLALRILKFSYDTEYDPLAENGGVGEISKAVYNYNELNSDNLERIAKQVEASQAKLFDINRDDDKVDQKARNEYKEAQRASDGNLYDSLTGQKESKRTYTRKDGTEVHRTDMESDHVQARASATYDSRYITAEGVEKLRDFWNSSDNFEMMQQVANQAKSDVRVCEVTENGITEIKYLTSNEMTFMGQLARHDGRSIVINDITYRATPEQMADAVIAKLEEVRLDKEESSQKKINALKKKGYLNEDGKVPRSVRQAMISRYRQSMNAQSIEILKGTDYKAVSRDAAEYAKSSIGKVIAGQVVYYTAPPIIYELRIILENKEISIDNALEKISEAATRVGKYVTSKLAVIFVNITHNSLKLFVKSFMDILISTVKATVKKLLKVAKNVVLATVDSVRIIANPYATSAEKADSVFTLFGVTVTSCAIETIFEIAGDVLKIPEPFDDIIFGPLQILTTIICTNLTLLILKKADLFNVRHGFKMSQIRKLFSDSEKQLSSQFELVEDSTDKEIRKMIDEARMECREIHDRLDEIDYKEQEVTPELQKISSLFCMDIDFEREWMKFIGPQASA